jgi:hypothetical protein
MLVVSRRRPRSVSFAEVELLSAMKKTEMRNAKCEIRNSKYHISKSVNSQLSLPIAQFDFRRSLNSHFAFRISNFAFPT